MEVISLILNFDFHILGIDFKFLYLVVLVLILRIFFIIYGRKG